MTEYAVIDRLIRHLELTFVAEKLPRFRPLGQVTLLAAEASAEYE